MGFIRGSLLTISCIIFFLAVLISLICLTISSSLSYENIKPSIINEIKKVSETQTELKQSIESSYPAIIEACKTQENYTFTDEKGAYNFNIPCEIAVQGTDKLIEYGTSQLVEQIYYAEYNCNFWGCLSKTDSPAFLVSKKSHDYFKNKSMNQSTYKISPSIIILFS